MMIHRQNRNRSYLMSKNKITYTEILPPVIVGVGYRDLYDDYDTVEINDILDGVPSVVIINYIAENLGKVLYAFSDTRTQRQLIRDFCSYVAPETKKRIWRFTNNVPECMLYETYGCCLLYGLVLQNYTPLEEGDDELDLCEDEYEKVLKAITYCNQRWTDEQAENVDMSNLVKTSIKIDVPIVEFKKYKDFRYQIYKAIPFFQYLELDPYYKQEVLPAFYADKKVNNWQEYFNRIFNLYAQSLHGHILDISKGTKEDENFFAQFKINIDECANLWDGHNAVNYFRNHFLYQISDKEFILLNANFLVDKIFQGVKFDIYQTIEDHGILNKHGKKYNGKPDFLGEIGESFSESHLMYSLMNKTFAGQCDVIYTGAELKAKGVDAEPDLYMRIGRSLFLFEYKDVTLSDAVRYSSNVDDIITTINNKICLYEQKKHKGAGQLHYSADQIVNNHSMDAIDKGVKDVEKIFPIILTTDRAYSAIGVQMHVVNEFSKFPNINFRGFYAIPIIIDFDTLIDLSYRLHNGELQLEALLHDYLFKNKTRLTPFSNHVEDNYKRRLKGQILDDEVRYLFDDMVKKPQIFE